MEYVIKAVGVVVVVLLALIGLSLLLCLPLMWTWNYVMPYLFAFKTITWSQAWCLSFVCSTLLKSYSTTTK